MTNAISSARETSRPRRGLNLVESSLYCGIAPDLFLRMVDEGKMPKPRLIASVRVWDVVELDIYFNALPYDERDKLVRTPAAKRGAAPFGKN